MTNPSNTYRLSDMIRGCWGGRKFHYENYPDSIATQYMKIKNKFPKKEKVISFSKIDFKSLTSIIKRKKYKDVKKPDSNTIIIHLRVGDVIDRTKLTVDDFLHKSPAETKFKNGKNYVYNLDYYKHIITELPTSIKNVVFVYGYKNRDEWRYQRDERYRKDPRNSCEKSEEYIAKLKTFFESKGYSVTKKNCHTPIDKQDLDYKNLHKRLIKISKNADIDFVYMCNAKHFVKSGGGFSEIISNVVQLQGNNSYPKNNK